MKNKENFKGTQINLRLSILEREELKKRAKAKNKTLSRYLIDKGLKG